MSEYSLLFFHKPKNENLIKNKIIPPKIITPLVNKQWERLSKKIDELLNNKISIQSTTHGIEPEKVLVIETIGYIADLTKAINKINKEFGIFELLDEPETEEVEPDGDFYSIDEKGKKLDKNLTGKLYAIMTDDKAKRELFRLWENYSKDDNFKFPRGLTTFRDLFLHIKDIRYWNYSDRLNLEEWKDIDFSMDSNECVKFEIELWFRKNFEARQKSREEIKNILEELGGSLLKNIEITEICCHVILAQLPMSRVSELLQSVRNKSPKDIKLLDLTPIMYFYPMGQVVTDSTLSDDEDKGSEYLELENQKMPSGNPIIAMLDGFPLANHGYLRNRVIVEDIFDFEDTCPSEHRLHGTAIASSIIFGDLNNKPKAINKPILSIPILKPNNFDYFEKIPEDFIFVDIIHRAVKNIIEKNPSVKIINLSIGVSNRPFINSISAAGKLLDWLSAKYNVLFIISSGNGKYLNDISYNFDSFKNLGLSERTEIIIKYLCDNVQNQKILSPSESINSIAVGAVHYDSSNFNEIMYANLVNPLDDYCPSMFSSFGFGYNKSIKPDIVFAGGRDLYSRNYIDNNLEKQKENNRFGIRVATPSSKDIVNLNNTGCVKGTSFATSLITHNASVIYDVLEELFEENKENLNKYSAQLIKAMLVHGCSWDSIEYSIRNTLSKNNVKEDDINELIRKIIGYGLPDIGKVIKCTDNRTTLIGFGEIEKDKVHIFKFPVPESLNANKEERKLTITLAWFSPISPQTQKYKISNLYFEINNDNVACDRCSVCGGRNGWRTVRKGTLQHEIFKGEKAIIINENDEIEIKVICKENIGQIIEPIAYGLIASLEVAEGINIYNEIKDKIATRIKIQ